MSIKAKLLVMPVVLLTVLSLVAQNCSLCPKLSNRLQELIEADRQGEAEQYAEQQHIDLVDGQVKVVVECYPDMIEEATRVAHTLGAVKQEPIVRGDYIYAGILMLVPINNLNNLAKKKSVRRVALPSTLLPQ